MNVDIFTPTAPTMPSTTHAVPTPPADPVVLPGDHAPGRYALLLWISVHWVPLLLVPLLTTTLGPSIGLDAAAALTHATFLTLVPLAEAELLRRAWPVDAAWRRRAVLAMAAAIATAMIIMSSIDLAGHDALATPGAMAGAGIVHGLILGWPLLRVAARYQWIVASTLGWLAGAVGYRLLLDDVLALEIGDRSLYGYAYTGGHNELLWAAAGIACFGVATGLVIHLAPRRAPRA